jgi:Zn-dependent M28 family amino/carboxypeptidase
VLFDVPMGDGLPAVERYGDAVAIRVDGASRAAAQGAVAVLVRSVTTRTLYTPHTGGVRYDSEQARIPAAAVSPEDASWMSRLDARGIEVRARLVLGAHAEADAASANVIAEVRGAERPDEIVLIGAHLDSWDVGQGAHDDGSGVVEAMEALRLVRDLGVPPRRTIRAVLFTNEENGMRAAKSYAEAHEGEVHVAAMESDLGAGEPRGFTVMGTPAQVAWLRGALAPLGLPLDEGGGGADVSPLEEQGVLVAGLRTDDSHYFDVHHTRADTLDKVDAAALREGVRAVAAFAWLAANAPDAPHPAPHVAPAVTR